MLQLILFAQIKQTANSETVFAVRERYITLHYNIGKSGIKYVATHKTRDSRSSLTLNNPFQTEQFRRLLMSEEQTNAFVFNEVDEGQRNDPPMCKQASEEETRPLMMMIMLMNETSR